MIERILRVAAIVGWLILVANLVFGLVAGVLLTRTLLVMGQ